MPDEDDREVDFLAIDADAATGGDEDVAVVEGVGEVRQAGVEPRRVRRLRRALRVERCLTR